MCNKQTSMATHQQWAIDNPEEALMGHRQWAKSDRFRFEQLEALVLDLTKKVAELEKRPVSYGGPDE